MILLVVLRLPAINRPVSKHHEFNTAVVLINAESWIQAGGPEQFNYTPLLNYQGASNRVFEKGDHVDAKGNHVYLSFGNGWYVVPWFVFHPFKIAFTPLNLRILSISIGLITILLLYRLIVGITKNKYAAFAAALVFGLLPVPLWYCGIGYVTTAIMLPLVIVVLMLWHQFEIDVKNISVINLPALLFTGICLCWCDWISVFLFATIMIWALHKSCKVHRYLWVAAFAFVAMLLPVFMVLFQFADYLGWHQVLGYWKSRFTDRSSAVEGGSLWYMFRLLAINLISGFLPLVFPAAVYVWKHKYLVAKQKTTWPLWALGAIVFYNGIFFNWSVIHQFAWMAFGLFAAVFFGIYLFPFLSKKQLNKMLAITSLLSLIMYFIINPPGTKSFSGEAYNQQQLTGLWIKTHVNSEIPIFITGNTDKVIEYYSKRTFTTVESLPAAKSTLVAFHLTNAVLLNFEDAKVKRITWLHAK